MDLLRPADSEIGSAVAGWVRRYTGWTKCVDADRARKVVDPDGRRVRSVLRKGARPDGASASVARRLGGGSDRAKREAPNPPHFRSPALCDAAFAALDKLNRGVMLLDADGVVQYMNRAARAILNRGHGLSLRQRRLVFAAAGDTSALDSCLAHETGSLLLRVGGQSHAHRPYAVLVSPNVGADGTGGFSVFIHEPPAKRSPVPTQVLRDLYGLTPAEARLANALYVGQSLQSAAGTGGISLNTAKSVLKRVFVKCEVGTQAELLQVLSLGPRTL